MAGRPSPCPPPPPPGTTRGGPPGGGPSGSAARVWRGRGPAGTKLHGCPTTRPGTERTGSAVQETVNRGRGWVQGCCHVRTSYAGTCEKSASMPYQSTANPPAPPLPEYIVGRTGAFVGGRVPSDTTTGIMVDSGVTDRFQV